LLETLSVSSGDSVLYFGEDREWEIGEEFVASGALQRALIILNDGDDDPLSSTTIDSRRSRYKPRPQRLLGAVRAGGSWLLDQQELNEAG